MLLDKCVALRTKIKTATRNLVCLSSSKLFCNANYGPHNLNLLYVDNYSSFLVFATKINQHTCRHTDTYARMYLEVSTQTETFRKCRIEHELCLRIRSFYAATRTKYKTTRINVLVFGGLAKHFPANQPSIYTEMVEEQSKNGKMCLVVVCWCVTERQMSKNRR